MSAESPTEAAAPTAVEERLEALDVIRGFALFGILAVNLNYWFRTYPSASMVAPERWPGPADQAVDLLIMVLCNGKFITLFSMLFGVGLALQQERIEARGARFYRFAARRFGALFLLGALHVALLWMGDILHIYAVLGFVLLLFLRRRTRTIAIWAGVLLALPLLFSIGFMLVKGLARAPMPPEALEQMRREGAAAVQAYAHGTWLEIARRRWVEYVDLIGTLIPSAYGMLVAFLVGLLAWRSGAVQRPSDHLPRLRRVVCLGLAFGIGQAVLRRVLERALPDHLSRLVNLVYGLEVAAFIALALAYGAALLLLLQRPAVRARLAPLASAGRMALTNYLLQSLICGLIFYNYGLGLYDRIGPAAGLGVTVAIYAAQLVWSPLWLRRFRFGPVEWLWRTMTYGRAQPMRV